MLVGSGGSSPSRPPPARPVASDRVRVGPYRIQTWNDDLYAQLRERDGVPEGFLETLDVSKHISKDSKSTSPLIITQDEQFLVKGLTSVDHNSLLQHSAAYTARLLGGGTLLCPIYLHFRLLHSGESAAWPYIAMRNLTPRVGTWRARYDLKGCDDDKTLEWECARVRAVHRRWWRVHRWPQCTWSAERWVYFEGKLRAHALRIHLPATAREELLAALRADVRWLAAAGLMDYSLLVGVRDDPPAGADDGAAVRGLCEAQGGGGRRAWAVRGEGAVQFITVGIVDCLQPWTLKKRAAYYLKVCEPNKATVPPIVYGHRFVQHFEECFQPCRGLYGETSAQATGDAHATV